MYNRMLDTFIAVADCGSFTKAADLLYVSPTAVMKQMNALEKELDLLLLERTSSGVRPVSYTHLFEISEGDFTEVEHGLSAGQFDIGLIAIQNITNFETITLKKDQLFVLLTEDHPLADELFFPIESLKTEPFIYLDEGNDNDSQIIFKANHI